VFVLVVVIDKNIADILKLSSSLAGIAESLRIMTSLVGYKIDLCTLASMASISINAPQSRVIFVDRDCGDALTRVRTSSRSVSGEHVSSRLAV